MIKKQGIDQKAKKFRLTEQDFHNLYDLLYMINWKDYLNLKLNKMDKWLDNFFVRIEKIVVPEIYDKKLKGGKKNGNENR